jgi:hypothetical protein
MKLLLVESQPGIARTVNDRLRDAGHDVVMCSDEYGDQPCRSVADGAACPLHEHVDLAVVAKADDSVDTLLEMGAVCAERYRIPVVRLDPKTCGDPVDFVRRSAAGGKDRVEAEYAAVVRANLVDLDATVEATREPGRVQIVVGVDDATDATARSRAADRARAAVREFDPFVRSIDVSVTTR